MRQIKLNGFLAADAEVKMSKQGNAYLSFRMANNEYNEEKTHWYNVTTNIPFYVNMAKHFKKGSNVIVTGDYSDDIYQTKTGTCDISRNIRAVAIYFNNSGRSGGEEGKTTTNESVTPSAKASVSEVKMGEFKPTAAKTSSKPAVTVSDEDDDDLPF
jgi:single stranded DNA-binding protein